MVASIITFCSADYKIKTVKCQDLSYLMPIRLNQRPNLPSLIPLSEQCVREVVELVQQL